MLKLALVSFGLCCVGAALVEKSTQSGDAPAGPPANAGETGDEWSTTMTLPEDIKLTVPDTYICTGMRIPAGSSNVFEFETIGGKHIHHLIFSSCPEPWAEDDHWECRSHGGVCKGGGNVIMWAWALDAPSFKLPPGVGFEVGKPKSKYYVLQIHFKVTSPDGVGDKTGITFKSRAGKPRLWGGMMLSVGYGFTLPPNKPNIPVVFNCRYNGGRSVTLFHFRTHAHSLGSMITGTLYKDDGTAAVIARGSPQRPQVCALWFIVGLTA